MADELPFPEFPVPTPVDALRSWTATFDSYDQRNDDIYHLVTIHEDAVATARFVVRSTMPVPDPDWTTPESVAGLHREIHDVARGGATNTSYTGSMSASKLGQLPDSSGPARS